MKAAIMIILVGVLGVTLSAVATADSGWYLGGGYTKLDFSAGSEDLDFSTIGAQVGYNLSSSFAVELRGAKGQADDDISGYDFEVDKTVSLLAKFSLANDTNITPYLIGGYTKAWLEGEGGYKEDDGDWSYGAGAAFALTKQLAVSAEYAVLYDKDDSEIIGLSLMANYTF
jgi:outer membrane immunogenic protein